MEQDQQRLSTSGKLLTYTKNRVETVLETLPEAVLVLDESGEITFVNQKLAAMFNVSQDVAVERPRARWCDNPDTLQLLAKHKSSGKSRSFTDTIRSTRNWTGFSGRPWRASRPRGFCVSLAACS